MEENTYAETFACPAVLQIMVTNILLCKVKISVPKKVTWNFFSPKHHWAPSPKAGSRGSCRLAHHLFGSFHLWRLTTWAKSSLYFSLFIIKTRHIRLSRDSEIVALSSPSDSIILITQKVDFLPENPLSLSFHFPIWKDYLLLKCQFLSLNNDFTAKALKKDKKKLPLKKRLP